MSFLPPSNNSVLLRVYWHPKSECVWVYGGLLGYFRGIVCSLGSQARQGSWAPSKNVSRKGSKSSNNEVLTVVHDLGRRWGWWQQQRQTKIMVGTPGLGQHCFKGSQGSKERALPLPELLATKVPHLIEKAASMLALGLGGWWTDTCAPRTSLHCRNTSVQK